MSYDYDLFVIGAGSGGVSASRRAASYGAKVAIAENDLVGGTCVIRGCVPKKLMVYASSFSHLYQDALGYGWGKVEPSFEWQKMIEAVNKEVRRLSQVYIDMLEKSGVELIHGKAVFLDAHTVQVGERKITADKILIAVGGEAVKLDIPGIEYSITSREMFHLKEQPKRFAVIGGGYIAVEFACIMHGLGSEVTQIIRRDLILRGFDDDIRKDVQEGMIKHGVKFLTETRVEKIEKKEDGLELTLAGKGAGKITVDAVLCATGRQPNIKELGLENAGVEVVNGAIAVKPDSCTSQPNIYAVGDCTNRVNLTPVAIAQGRAFADTVFGHIPRYITHKNIPSAVFAQPEAATVGMSEAEAREKLGDNVIVYRTKFRPMFHSLTGADEKVMIKLVVDRVTERVLGAHMVGKDAAEIIQGIAIAINMGATKKDFDNTIALHPSSAEEFVLLR
ncbi:MAG: glutathione-disulfide reductase [Oscillatoriaceae bacterium SKW80]|nr:glutathione-disulfide reductase [Oscillatoriaceae bacterium SKYG93]MCX8121419.1 glutathione-disulfide reductase [Oscillatoriaceae bacterium SKW80]MDW8451904.1 glutathione-disulfide reductase [Oscillatoriaceae cyanobacterium SKYGB_i_bin93]HIK29447.1 glutathione-disulfide reductase [Oscillatoriaceae cyanobacterium M7585_C2015_266]